jgi:hypothetical protein
LDKSDSLRDRHQLERDDSDGSNLVGTNLVGKQPHGSRSFAHVQEYQPGNDRIEWFIGNESIEVGGDKPRPITSTGNCCPLLGYMRGLR